MSDARTLLRLAYVAATIGLVLLLTGAWTLSIGRLCLVLTGLVVVLMAVWLASVSDLARRHPDLGRAHRS